MRPLVSFVVPVKNDAQRLRRCLTRILANDYPRELIEIIVVDNESTDGSGRVAREHGAVVLRAGGDRVAELRNRGARAALGTIIAFADADHEVDSHWIQSAVDVLADASVAATGAPYSADPGANWVQQQYDGFRERLDHRQEVTWLGSGNFAVKRWSFERVGGFNAALTACEDVDLCNRLRLAGHRIVADPGLRSVHYGDPKTLKALFLGELWRGRDNLRVTFSGPRTLRNWRSGLIPIAQLAALAAGAGALIAGMLPVALICWLTAVAPALARAALVIRRRIRPTFVAAVQAVTVSIVFDLARAFALLTRGSHRARRSA